MSNQLIPIAYFKEECFISDNIDERKLRSHLNDAEQDLMELLGREFFEEIQTQYNATPQTLTADNAALYEGYIKKVLAWQTYLYFLGFSNSDSTPSGEREFIDENSTVLNDVKMWSKEKNVRMKSERWRNRMINFLNESQSNDEDKYPLWEDSCKEVFSFGITAVDKNSDAMIRVNRSIQTNE
jgi:hypothetical protein